MLGSLLGVKILAVAKPKIIRYMVIAVLFFAGLKAIDKGLGLGLFGIIKSCYQLGSMIQ